MQKILLAFLILNSFSLFAQSNWCGTPNPTRTQLRRIRPVSPEPYRGNGTKLYIPVTLHIIGNDDGTGFFPAKNAYDAFCQLQTDFADSDISFYLADTLQYHRSTLYNNHPDFTVGGQMVSDYSVPSTLNCFIVENAAGNCGYAWFGGAIVLKNSCTTKPNHTWAHEAGHYFSLPHVFVGWEGQNINMQLPAPAVTSDGTEVELADSSNCATAADGFCDTPADYLSYRWSCDVTRNSLQMLDPTGRAFKASGEFYMSYSSDGCMTHFSPQQITAMRDYAQTTLPSITQLTPPPFQPTSQVMMRYPSDSLTTRYDTLTFRWKRDPNATLYTFEVSRQNAFQLVQYTKYTSDTSITLYNLSPGKHYLWRVRSINPAFTCAPMSRIQHFFTQAFVNTDSEKPFNGQLALLPNNGEHGQTIKATWQNIDSDFGKLQIFSINGQLLSEKNVYTNIDSETDIDTSTLPAGVFIVNLQTERGNVQQKLILF